jgi:hypothetical protein
MAKTIRQTVTHHVYRTYLIRWSEFTVIKPDNRVWVEKDNAFICWADSVDAAKAKIDELFS